jgi:hypothetical protein
MLVMAVLLLAGTTFLTISSTESQIATNERLSAQAFLLAEAAIHKAIAQLNAGGVYSGESSTPLGGGAFSVSSTTTPGCTAASARILAASAVWPGPPSLPRAEARVQVTVDRVSYPYRWAAFAAVSNGVVGYDWLIFRDRTDKELWLRNESVVDSFDSGAGAYSPAAAGTGGNIGANGDVTVEWDSQIHGSIKAGDAIFTGSGVTVDGSQTSQAPIQTFPAVAPGTTPTGGLAVGAGQTITLPAGDTTHCDASTRTCYYSSMVFGDGASLRTSGDPVTIYVTGVVVAGQNVTLGSNPGTQLRIFTKSDAGSAQGFFTRGDFRFYGSLYGTNTDLYLGEDAQIFGSMIGRTIYARDEARFHYDQAMSNQEICHNGKFSIRRGTWREVIPNS